MPSRPKVSPLLNRLLDTIIARVERSTALDPLAEKAAGLLQGPLRSPAARSMLSGTAAGHPVHPVLVTAPIGAWISAGVLDASSDPHRQTAATRLTGVGVLTALPAALTGAGDWVYTTGAERRVGFVHAGLNYLGLAVFGASWLARRRNHHALGRGLSRGGIAVIAVAGWLGGHLSYARGVGVDTTAFQVGPQDWTDVAEAADLVDGVPILVHAAGVPIMVIRLGASVRALADRCTHRGAPLHEGVVADGCISCPWHGSRFRLADGQVTVGPATRSQPRYKARVSSGMVQVRRSEEPGSLRTNPVS